MLKDFDTKDTELSCLGFDIFLLVIFQLEKHEITPKVEIHPGGWMESLP